MQDTWFIYDTPLNSRLLVGSALYPSMSTMLNAIQQSETQVVTVSLRRQTPQKSSGNDFWKSIQSLHLNILPNTSGCYTVNEVLNIAKMSREIFATDWIKLELIGDDYNLQPDPIELIKAAQLLIKDNFKVLPYCTDDLVICQKLVDIGCQVIMPWAAPIGTGKGILNPYALETLRARLDKTTLIIDAGIGQPSDATKVLELGYDAVLLNSAIALSEKPQLMANAFKHAIIAGREAYLAGKMPEKQLAQPSSPQIDSPFWHELY